MNEDTLVVVHCYDGDRSIVENFMPIWRHHERPILVLSPEDSRVDINDSQVSSRFAGKRGWKGQHTIRRQVEHWRLALDYAPDAKWFFLNDADSMCITPDIGPYVYSDPFKLWCNVLCHENEHQEDDHPNLNPPYFMSRDVLRTLLEEADRLDPELPQDAFTEPRAWGEAIDGFYTHLVLDVLGIPYENYPDGITTWPRGVQDVLQHALNDGARFVHGLKASAHLSLMTLNYKVWLVENQPAAREFGISEGETISVPL